MSPWDSLCHFRRKLSQLATSFYFCRLMYLQLPPKGHISSLPSQDSCLQYIPNALSGLTLNSSSNNTWGRAASKISLNGRDGGMLGQPSVANWCQTLNLLLQKSHKTPDYSSSQTCFTLHCSLQHYSQCYQRDSISSWHFPEALHPQPATQVLGTILPSKQFFILFPSKSTLSKKCVQLLFSFSF